MKVIETNVQKIIPYENNPRINNAAVKKVANSIEAFGFQQPIVVDKNFVVVVGHTRLKAAIELGMTTVPVVVADKLTEAQIQAYRIADNKVSELSEWDFDKLAIEMDGLDGIDMTDFGFDEADIAPVTHTAEKTTLAPYKKAHYLITVDINQHDKVLEYIEMIKKIDGGVEVEGSLN